MNSISKPYESQTKAFPKLMLFKNTGLIALMVSPKCGTVVHVGNSVTFKLGEWSTKFAQEGFKDFNGEVTLSND